MPVLVSTVVNVTFRAENWELQEGKNYVLRFEWVRQINSDASNITSS
jgi:hypothetical protein